MRRVYSTTFPPDVKLPTLGQVLTACKPDQKLTIWADTVREPLVVDTPAGDVTMQSMYRYAECTVTAVELGRDYVLNVGIVFGGVGR